MNNHTVGLKPTESAQCVVLRIGYCINSGR